MPEYVCLALTPGPRGQIMENNKSNFFNDTELVSDRWVIWAQLDASTEMLKSPPKYIWIFLLKYPEYNEKKKSENNDVPQGTYFYKQWKKSYLCKVLS